MSRRSILLKRRERKRRSRSPRVSWTSIQAMKRYLHRRKCRIPIMMKKRRKRKKMISPMRRSSSKTVHASLTTRLRWSQMRRKRRFMREGLRAFGRSRRCRGTLKTYDGHMLYSSNICY
jgi:hypothetical protein